MRVSKELKKTKRDMKVLKENYDNLQRKYRNMARSMQRMKQKKCKSPTTPRLNAVKHTECIDVTAEQERSVKKELVFAKVICEEIKLAGHKSTIHKKRILQNLVAGHLVKKYKLLRKLREGTGMSRNRISKITSKSVIVTKISRFHEVA